MPCRGSLCIRQQLHNQQLDSCQSFQTTGLYHRHLNESPRQLFQHCHLFPQFTAQKRGVTNLTVHSFRQLVTVLAAVHESEIWPMKGTITSDFGSAELARSLNGLGDTFKFQLTWTILEWKPCVQGNLRGLRVPSANGFGCRGELKISSKEIGTTYCKAEISIEPVWLHSGIHTFQETQDFSDSSYFVREVQVDSSPN